MSCRRIYAAAIVCLIFSAVPVSLPAKSPENQQIAALCEKARAAYVFISGGSGVIIRPDGLMLTNSHVTQNQKDFDVRTGQGKHYRAKLLGHDPFGDLAVLKLEIKSDEQVPFMELGDSDQLKVGETTLAVGNPFALGFVDQSPTFTLGIVSALHQIQGRYTECIVTDAEINPGNSGGPLINMQGKVVGINGQISTRWGLRSNTGLGFAISARQIGYWLPRLTVAEGNAVRHGRLVGVRFDATNPESPASLTVKQVFAESPAAKAGLMPGDVIVRWDGQPVANSLRLASIMGMYPVDHQVGFEVRRGENTVPLQVSLVALKRASLGIKIAKPADTDPQVKVQEVAPDSIAAKSGMQAGDLLMEIEGAKLEGPVAVQFRILEVWLQRGADVFDTINIKVRRKNEAGESKDLELSLAVPDSQDAKPFDPKPIGEDSDDDDDDE
ncbi:MAG: hypothetical protein RIS70_2346 [Planctomycetota bacterium]